MAYRNNPSFLNRDYSKSGFTTPSDVYDRYQVTDNIYAKDSTSKDYFRNSTNGYKGHK